MVNTSPTCGICFSLSNMEEGSQKEEIIALLNGTLASEKLSPVLGTKGLTCAASSIRRHRREEKPQGEVTQPQMVQQQPTKPPPGWEPYSEFTDSIGKAIVHLPKPNATARDLLITGGFDPDEWQISGPINTRRWMRYDQQWLYYYKFDVVAGESPEVVERHVDELVSVIRTRKIEAPAFHKAANDAWAFGASDWQIGKKEGNDGTPQTIERVLTAIDMSVSRVKELRRHGHMIPTLLFAGTGDLGEGTCGFYPGQQFVIDRTRREQGRINRELITKALDELTPLFDRTVVAAVGGNHGENRGIDGKRITSDGDNDDCAYFDAVKEAFDRSGRDDISWHIMDDELSMMVEAGGVPVGLTHGHLFGNGSTAQKKALEWWKGQEFGFQAVRGSRILLSSHFHHFSAVTYGSRTHLQTPAMDPGSKWFREISGEDTPAGVLTFRLDADTPLGWEDLQILHP